MVPRRAAGRVGPSPLSGPVGLVLGALAVSRVIYWQRGLRFDVGFVGSAMQVADWDLLRREPLSTAWYLHLQPPLFNLFVGAGANVFGSWAGLGFQAVYLLATVAMLVAFVHLCLDLGIGARMTTVLGIVLAVSPTIAQYESLLFYAHLEVVLLVLAARSLQRWCLNRSGGSLAAFTTALCCLALGRSLYHPVWFLGLGVLLVLAARRTLTRRALVGAVALPLLCGVAIGAKNAAVFGWWTTSSLEGINLHRVSEPYLTDAERARLIEDGTITEVSEDAFSCGRPADRRSSSGPDRAIPVLDREWRKADRRVANLNNRHQLQCLEALRNESIRVVVRAPDAYLRAVGRAATVASYNAVPDVRTRVGNQRALRGPGRIEATLLGSIAPAPGPFDRSYGIVQPQRMQWVLVLAALVVPLYLASLLFARLRARAAAPDTPVLAFMLYVALRAQGDGVAQGGDGGRVPARDGAEIGQFLAGTLGIDPRWPHQLDGLQQVALLVQGPGLAAQRVGLGLEVGQLLEQVRQAVGLDPCFGQAAPGSDEVLAQRLEEEAAAARGAQQHVSRRAELGEGGFGRLAGADDASREDPLAHLIGGEGLEFGEVRQVHREHALEQVLAGATDQVRQLGRVQVAVCGREPQRALPGAAVDGDGPALIVGDEEASAVVAAVDRVVPVGPTLVGVPEQHAREEVLQGALAGLVGSGDDGEALGQVRDLVVVVDAEAVDVPAVDPHRSATVTDSSARRCAASQMDGSLAAGSRSPSSRTTSDGSSLAQAPANAGVASSM